MSNPKIKIVLTEDICSLSDNQDEKAGEVSNSSHLEEPVQSVVPEKLMKEKESPDDDLVILNIGNDIDNSEEHSSGGDMDDSQTASTRGSTTPILESSSSSSPISELSEKSPNESDVEKSSDNKYPINKCDISSELKPVEPLSMIMSTQKRLMYSREELLMLMDVPASRLWPDYFDISFKKLQGKIDMEKWIRSQQDLKGSKSSTNKVSGTNTSSTSSHLGNLEKLHEKEFKKSRDPRERIKDEQDGIVLSPQRRSFSTGCQVVPQVQSSYEMPVADRQRDPHRDPLPVRRIGSGRIIRRDESDHSLNERRRDRENVDREQDPRRDHKDWRSKFDNRYDHDERHADRRRKFFEDEDKKGVGGRRDFGSGRDNRRYSEGRRYSFSKEEEEPEWFTGGPSSQNEFIDLVGFEEDGPYQERINTEMDKPKRERRRSRRENSGSARNSRCTTPVIKEVEEPVDTGHDSQDEKIQSSSTHDQLINDMVENDQDDIQFNVEDYLGSILNIGGDEMFDNETTGVSRLKKFFKNRESPIEKLKSPSVENQQPFTQVGSLLGFNEPVVRVPSPNAGLDSTRFFAPISPADKPQSGENIVDMLHQVNSKRIAPQAPLVGSGRLPPPSLKDLLMDGRGQILEELEANMRKDHHQPSSSSSSERPVYMKHPGFVSQQPGFPTPSTSMHMPNSASNPFNDTLLTEKGLKYNEQMDPTLASKSGNTQKQGEVINRLLKIGNVGGHVPSMSSVNGPLSRLQTPVNNNLGVSNTHSLSSNIPNNIPQHASPRPVYNMPMNSQAKPTSFNADFMKLMQTLQKKQMAPQNYPSQPMQSNSFPQGNADPIKQLLGGMNNMSLTPTNQSHQDTQQEQLKEKLIRPDVEKLLQRIVNGQLNEGHLITQLNSGKLNAQQRETVAIVLKILNSYQPLNSSLTLPRANLSPSPTFPQNMFGGGIGVPGSSLSPRVASPNQEAVNMLTPQMMPHTRLSPLLYGNASVPRRTPSHQEMVAHTQNIMHKALIKQELEKAKEKHRKKESEGIPSPNPMMTQIHNGTLPMMNSNIAAAVMNSRTGQVGSPTKGLKCQSPLAFTPTSVMRKMTAEKERSDKDFKPEGYSLNEFEKSVRHSMGNNIQQGIMPNISFPPAGHAKMGDKRMTAGHSALSSAASSMLGPRAQMVMGGNQTIPMVNTGAATHSHTQAVNPTQQQQQRAAAFQQTVPNMGLPRANHHVMNNIRALQQAQQDSINQQMMRGQMASAAMVNPNRMSSSQSAGMQHMVMGNNTNNNFKFGESNNLPGGHHGGSTQQSSFNLMNLFGHDAFNKAQGGSLPDLPGGKVLSLEEVERLQQTRT